MDADTGDIFKAVADVNRRHILSALCAGPKVAGELARMVGLAPNALSFHLKWLRQAGLVSIRREGRFLRYRVERSVLADWTDEVQRLFFTSGPSQPGWKETPGAGRRESGRLSRPRPIQPQSVSPSADTAESQPDRLPTELL
jgi:DNA-binding transcriptional ArsR family regulator